MTCRVKQSISVMQKLNFSLQYHVFLICFERRVAHASPLGISEQKSSLCGHSKFEKNIKNIDFFLGGPYQGGLHLSKDLHLVEVSK